MFKCSPNVKRKPEIYFVQQDNKKVQLCWEYAWCNRITWMQTRSKTVLPKGNNQWWGVLLKEASAATKDLVWTCISASLHLCIILQSWCWSFAWEIYSNEASSKLLDMYHRWAKQINTTFRPRDKNRFSSSQPGPGSFFAFSLNFLRLAERNVYGFSRKRYK